MSRLRNTWPESAHVAMTIFVGQPSGIRTVMNEWGGGVRASP